MANKTKIKMKDCRLFQGDHDRNKNIQRLLYYLGRRY